VPQRRRSSDRQHEGVGVAALVGLNGVDRAVSSAVNIGATAIPSAACPGQDPVAVGGSQRRIQTNAAVQSA